MQHRQHERDAGHDGGDAEQDLRSERERQGLSLSDVADRTGMDRSFISRLETSPSPNPTVSTLHRYAECLGVDIQIALVQR